MSKRQPIYDINDYLLNGTEVGPLLGWPSTTGLRPILPVQQQPEPNERNKTFPYIVYSFRTVGGFDHWWTHTEEATFVIWGSSFDELSEVANEIIDNLHALDESAQDLMRYIEANNMTNEWEFHYIRLLSSTSPNPALQESGRLAWYLTFRYEYSPVNGKHIG